ncbi:hypothetical protein FQA39_LY00232 [Lamprigera yunnana]|nr:hypothetical protein FQA39_LY00232 [Lamprigera yunnana]
MANVIQSKRKRDKRKKKEEVIEEFHQPIPNVTDDLNIHVHKEVTTGGGLCAKLIFFALLIILSTLIGLLITEHRGLSDLDTLNTETAFARILEGWIDTNPEYHEEVHSVERSHDDHDDDDIVDDDEDDLEPSRSMFEEDEEEDEGELSRDQEESKTVSEEDEEEEENEEEDEDQEESETQEQVYDSESESPISSLEKQMVLETNEEEGEPSVVSKDEQESEDEDEEANFQSDISERVHEKNRQVESDKIKLSEGDAQGEDELYENVISIAPQTLLPEGAEEVEKIEQLQSETTEIPTDNEKGDGSSNMVVRFGVGASLLVVAHVVLIRKWRTANVNKSNGSQGDEENVNPDLSRRDTIVPPPTLDEIGQNFEHVEKDYSEDEEEDEDEEENYDDDDDDDDNKPLTPLAKNQYQELRSTYSHNLSPSWEPRQAISNSEAEDESDEEDREDNEDGYYEDEDEEVEQGDQYDDEISEDEDEELLRRLEAKYGILQQTETDEVEEEEDEEDEEEDEEENFEEDGSRNFDHWKREKIMPLTRNSDSEDDSSWPEKRPGANNVYDFSNITNVEDWKIREELDEAGNNLANDPAYALILFNKILEKQPFSPRATYGKAQSFDALAEKKKSNKLLEESIITYQQVLKFKDVPDILFQMAAYRVINRMRFRGVYIQTIPIHKLLVSKFPDSVDFQNELAVTYLTMNNFYEAKRVLYDILLKWPEDGFAMVNYGFILKLHDLDLKQAVKYLKKGIATGDPGVIDGRFYYHLGDALIRMGRKEEASIVHLEGVDKKVFLSKYQRSLHNVNRLIGKPWWKKEDLSNPKFFEKLEQHWKIIRDEGMSLLNTDGLFKTESEDLREIGDWKQFELYARGMKNVRNCKLCPRTCQLIEMFPDAVTCKRGQIKFSVVQPGTHVWPHCGPTNCRLRSHLGLKVPSNVYIRVADEIRSWKEGKLLIFDDSFEHEIWHNGSTTRLILIVDFWHPQLTKEEKLTLSSV